VEFPVSLALAQAVASAPAGTGWWAEPKFDGHRMAVWRLEETVVLQSRTGRDVTSQWMDLATAAMRLRPGTVVDGEAVVYRDGRIDFSAAQSRGASTPARARALAAEHPATYAAFDVLLHPDHGDVRQMPWLDRRALLLDLFEDLAPSPLQVVPASDDRDVAATWYDALRAQGVEGLVWKHERSVYKGDRRVWFKQRHAHTVDAEVLGYTGPVTRPRHLALRLPDGRVALSQTLLGPLAAQLSARLAPSAPLRQARTSAGGTYAVAAPGLVVEVLAGSTRHAVVTVTRLR
jgi:ATP-dependent DNA ligase